MDRRLVGLLALCAPLALLGPRPAEAASPAVGDKAPDFEGKEFVNGEPCSLETLRGQVVFLEIFRTWCGPCNQQAPHLTELHEKYGAKGLRVIGLTTEARGAVDAFVEKHSCKHMIVVESSDSGRAYGTNTVPSPWLIGADGRVLAQGIPSEAQIEEALTNVRMPPSLPKSLESLASPLRKQKLGEVRLKVGKALEGTTLVEDDRKVAEELRGWLDWRAESALADAKADGEKGDWYQASRGLEQTAAWFKGTPTAAAATEQLKGILADKEKRDAVTAGKRLQAALDQVREKDLDPKEALPLFKAIATKYETTNAGRRAAELVAALEEEMKKKD